MPSKPADPSPWGLQVPDHQPWEVRSGIHQIQGVVPHFAPSFREGGWFPVFPDTTHQDTWNLPVPQLELRPLPFPKRGGREFWGGDMRSNGARAPESGTSSEPGYRVQRPCRSFGHPPLGLLTGVADRHAEPWHLPLTSYRCRRRDGRCCLGHGGPCIFGVPWKLSTLSQLPMNPEHPSSCSALATGAL